MTYEEGLQEQYGGLLQYRQLRMRSVLLSKFRLQGPTKRAAPPNAASDTAPAQRCSCLPVGLRHHSDSYLYEVRIIVDAGYALTVACNQVIDTDRTEADFLEFLMKQITDAVVAVHLRPESNIKVIGLCLRTKSQATHQLAVLEHLHTVIAIIMSSRTILFQLIQLMQPLLSF